MDTEHPRDEVHGEVERGQRDKPWQRYLDATLGLRNYWYPVLFSHELQEGETRPETLLGERRPVQMFDQRRSQGLPSRHECDLHELHCSGRTWADLLRAAVRRCWL